MPILNSKPCPAPGCREVTSGGPCARHKPIYSSDPRASASARGYDRHHRRWRILVLHRHPLCVFCERSGRLVPATEADHIVPLTKGGDWSLSNGQGLCKSCHSRKTLSGM
ncbi:MAG TPA: HNH endonuclease signature motif containing protein [Terriglobia bacterium]|nr:HNH endonuclease signature motif containing protein [Terriglobia bacterium]